MLTLLYFTLLYFTLLTYILYMISYALFPYAHAHMAICTMAHMALAGYHTYLLYYMGSNAQCPLPNGQIYNAQCPLPNAQVHKSMPKSRPYPQISWDLDHINLNRIPFLALDSSLLWPLPSTSFGLLPVFTHKGSIKRSVLESHTQGIPFLALDSSLLWPLPSTSSSLLSVLYVM